LVVACCSIGPLLDGCRPGYGASHAGSNGPADGVGIATDATAVGSRSEMCSSEPVQRLKRLRTCHSRAPGGGWQLATAPPSPSRRRGTVEACGAYQDGTAVPSVLL